MIFNRKKNEVPRRRMSDSTPVQTKPTDIFRRNRTLTGTTSNRFNAAASNSDLESSRTTAHKLSLQRRKITGMLVVVLLALGFLWLVISNLTASVSIQVNDSAQIAKTVDKSRYENAIQDYLRTDPVGRLSFFLDQNAMNAFVKNKLPEVEKITQRGMDGLGTTQFAITMRRPVAGWQINSRQYYVDANGVAFDKNYYNDPLVQIIDKSGVDVKSDATAVVSRRFLGFVGKVVYQSAQAGYAVTQASLPLGTTRELEVKVKGLKYPIKLSIDRAVGEQIEDMTAALRYFTSRHITPQYVDVRVSGKAYYK